jgi:predicted metal-dependent phosphotriesterase family hydrolase
MHNLCFKWALNKGANYNYIITFLITKLSQSGLFNFVCKEIIIKNAKTVF